MNQIPEEQKVNIREFYQKRLGRELSDAEVEEIYYSLYFFGRALARYERMKYERNGK